MELFESVGDSDWMKNGACLEVPDMSIFTSDDRSENNAAKLICQRCDVRLECLDYAIENKIEHHVWGGESGKGRRRIVRNRRTLRGLVETGQIET